MTAADAFHDPQSARAEPRISYVVARLERALRRSINDRVSALVNEQYVTVTTRVWHVDGGCGFESVNGEGIAVIKAGRADLR